MLLEPSPYRQCSRCHVPPRAGPPPDLAARSSAFRRRQTWVPQHDFSFNFGIAPHPAQSNFSWDRNSRSCSRATACFWSCCDVSASYAAAAHGFLPANCFAAMACCFLRMASLTLACFCVACLCTAFGDLSPIEFIFRLMVYLKVRIVPQETVNRVPRGVSRVTFRRARCAARRRRFLPSWHATLVRFHRVQTGLMPAVPGTRVPGLRRAAMSSSFSVFTSLCLQGPESMSVDTSFSCPMCRRLGTSAASTHRC
jgi:hypothetical protein